MLMIGNYEFHGPFSKAESLEERPGIYVVLCCEGDDVHEVLAVVTAVKNVRQHLLDNTEHDLWIEQCRGKLQVAAIYTSLESLEPIKSAVEREFSLDETARHEDQSGRRK